MPGILANSIDVYMGEGDATPRADVDGFVKGIEIAFAIVHGSAQTSWKWDLTRPSSDATAELVIADDYSSARLRPDMGGAWCLNCLVNGSSLYSIILNVLDSPATTPVYGQRLVRRHPDQVVTPREGSVLFLSSVTGVASEKLPNTAVRQLGAAPLPMPDPSGPKVALIGNEAGTAWDNRQILQDDITPVLSVANLTELTALDVAHLVDGTRVRVATLRVCFEIETSAVGVVAMQVVASSQAGRVWRRCSYPRRRANPWSTQDAFFLDYTNGNDENIGTDAGHAIKTLGELQRRTWEYEPAQATTAHVLADDTSEEIVLRLFADDEHYFCLDGQDGAMQMATGTVATWTPLVKRQPTDPPEVSEANLLTASDITDWTPYVKCRIRITSGAYAGCVGWILKANPNGEGVATARVGYVVDPTPWPIVVAAPAAGATFVVERLVQVGGVHVEHMQPQRPGSSWGNMYGCWLAVRFANLNLAALEGEIRCVGGNRTSQNIVVMGCEIGAWQTPGEWFVWASASINRVTDRAWVGDLAGGTSPMSHFYYCTFLGDAGSNHSLFANVMIWDSIAQGCWLRTAGGTAGTNVLDGVGIFDAPGYSVDCHYGDPCYMNGVWGKNNTGAVNILSSVVCNYSGTKPTVTSTVAGNDVRIGGVYYPWSAMPYFDTSINAGLLALDQQGGEGNAEYNPWLDQLTWYIDPVAGSDAATGADAGHPIQTLQELCRRAGPGEFDGALSVIVMSAGIDLTGTLHGTVHFYVMIDAQSAATTLLTGMLASWTARSEAANEYHLMTATGVSDWGAAGPGGSSLIQKRVRFLTGACAGSVCFIGCKNPDGAGANVARVSDLVMLANSIGAFSTPSPGDTFVVEELAVATGCDALKLVRPDSYDGTSFPYWHQVNSLRFEDPASAYRVHSMLAGSLNTRAAFVGCDFDNLLVGWVQPESLYVVGSRVNVGAEFGVFGTSFLGTTITKCLVTATGGASALVSDGATLTFNLFQGCPLIASGGVTRIMGGGHFDVAGVPIQCHHSGRAHFSHQVTVGKGNTGLAFVSQTAGNFNECAWYVYKPIGVGATPNGALLLTNGAVKLWAELPYIDADGRGAFCGG